MGVVLSCSRSRSRSFKFIVQLRKLAALCFIMHIKIYFRWIPSELNSSDKASRLYEQGIMKKKIFWNIWTTCIVEVLFHKQQLRT